MFHVKHFICCLYKDVNYSKELTITDRKSAEFAIKAAILCDLTAIWLLFGLFNKRKGASGKKVPLLWKANTQTSCGKKEKRERQTSYHWGF